MKDKFLVLILILLIGLSIEQEKHLSNKTVSAIKCLFDSKEKIELLIDLIENLFTHDIQYGWIASFLKLNDVFKECLNIDLADFLKF